MKHILQLTLILFLFGTSTAIAQTESPTDSIRVLYQVVKTDGTEFIGYIISDDGREILIETQTIGKVYINKSDIKTLAKATSYKVNDDGTLNVEDYRNEGPFTTRYYLTTNALPIKKKENYAMIHIYGPEVHFAVTDNLSLGVMTTWIGAPMALAAKYSFNSKTNTHYALGTIMASSSYLGNARGYGGLHWGTVTQGDRLTNISFSAGYGYVGIFGEDPEKYDAYRMNPSQNSYYSNKEAATRAKLNDLGKTGSLSTKNNLRRDAIVLGIAGIAPVGERASFIFDGMAFLGSKQIVEYRPSTSINVTYENWSGNTVTENVEIEEGFLTTSGINKTFLIMPGMRFNDPKGNAFQIVLAGVFTTVDDRTIAFPMPMVSWLRKF